MNVLIKATEEAVCKTTGLGKMYNVYLYWMFVTAFQQEIQYFCVLTLGRNFHMLQ